jgi:two-component system copper resistance phosphate regulon response regulator CusR
MRILLVEDEPRVASFIARGLREQSYAVDISSDGDDALYKASINSYDLIILDIMIPKKDGFLTCKELRGRGFKIPIMMLSARNTVDDRITGLDSGADDYLSKPFEFKELLAHLRALFRRQAEIRPEILTIADLSLNTVSHEVSRAGQSIILTAKEYALLEFLLLRKDKVVSREEIAEHVWDEHFDPFSNIVDVYIRRLRKKIDDEFNKNLIHTRRGEGYILTIGANNELV